MGWVRTVVGILVLSAIAYGVYVSMTRNPKASSRLDTAPKWIPPQGDLLSASTPQFPAGPGGARAGAPGSGTVPATPSMNLGIPAAPPAGVTGPSAAPASPAPAAATAVPAAPAGTSATRAPASPYPSIAMPAPPSQTATPTAPPSSGAPAPAAPAGGAPSSGLVQINPGASAPAAATPVVNPFAAPSGAHPPAAAAANPAPASPATAAVGPRPEQAPANSVREEFIGFMQAVQVALHAGRLDEAHRALSSLYNNPRLSPEETRQVTQLLDQTAGTLIYSRQHLIEQPYRVQPGDTLERIGQIYNVPGELLGKINGIRSSQQLVPGMELKVVRGPFDAEIDLSHYEMTLFLQKRYAGRFRIGVGRDRPPVEGTFTVREKKVNPPYPTAADPSDPLSQPGKRRIDLGNPTAQVAIHPADNPQNVGRAEGRGSIGLADRDIDDVFDILSVGSNVIIRR